jgi:hypothetical protein
MQANFETEEYIESLNSEELKKHAFVLIDMQGNENEVCGREGFLHGLQSLIGLIVKKNIFLADFNMRTKSGCVETTKSLLPAEKTNYKKYEKFEKNIFSNPQFEQDLKLRKIDTLIIAGAFTHGCIKASAEDSIKRLYNVILSSKYVTSTPSKIVYDTLKDIKENNFNDPHKSITEQESNDMSKFFKLIRHLKCNENAHMLLVHE